MQFFYAVNGQLGAADALNVCAHLDQKVAEIDNFRLTGGTFDACCAGGQYCGHGDIGSSGYGRAASATEKDRATADIARIDMYITAVYRDFAI